jgi:hypothetical protein
MNAFDAVVPYTIDILDFINIDVNLQVESQGIKQETKYLLEKEVLVIDMPSEFETLARDIMNRADQNLN